MSSSAFHRAFHAVTALSPIQFQKQVRLQHARLLLLAGADDAASAGFRVGYDSASQFSRDYETPLRPPAGPGRRADARGGRLSRQRRREAGEGGGVAPGWAVAEADDRRLEGGEAADLGAVEGRVGGEAGRRFVEAGAAAGGVPAEEDVGGEQGAVGLAPERDQAGGVAGGLQDGEGADLVALAQAASRPGRRDRPTSAAASA